MVSIYCWRAYVVVNLATFGRGFHSVVVTVYNRWMNPRTAVVWRNICYYSTIHSFLCICVHRRRRYMQLPTDQTSSWLCRKERKWKRRTVWQTCASSWLITPPLWTPSTRCTQTWTRSWTTPFDVPGLDCHTSQTTTLVFHRDFDKISFSFSVLFIILMCLINIVLKWCLNFSFQSL